ncbi:AfsR/SARP family transcriptional regulator [Nakamurella sp. GG22]
MGVGTLGVEVEVDLLGRFAVVEFNEPLRLPLAAQRLIAFLAINNAHAVHRTAVSEYLWPDSKRSSASANLRSALWLARGSDGVELVERNGPMLQLSPDAVVDYHIMTESARRIVDPAYSPREVAREDQVRLMTGFTQKLLPEWTEGWLGPSRECWDQVRVHGLETLAQRLIAVERHLPALEAALAAVDVDPLRESAHRTVVEVYIAEGNAACAVKHYLRYRGLVQRELGVTPSRHMTRLVHSLSAT